MINVRILFSAANMGSSSLANVVLPLDDGPERPIMIVFLLLVEEDCPAWLSFDILFSCLASFPLSFLFLFSVFPSNG